MNYDSTRPLPKAPKRLNPAKALTALRLLEVMEQPEAEGRDLDL